MFADLGLPTSDFRSGGFVLQQPVKGREPGKTVKPPKIIFFDLDGTLLRSHNGHVAFNTAFFETFGFSGDIRNIRPDGKTDPVILEEIFGSEDRSPDLQPYQWAAFGERLEACYAHAIESGHTRVLALPGVVELIREIATMEGVHQGVVTGNLEAIGRLKLRAVGLGEFLRLGAFGSDSRDRKELPPIALKRWEEHLGHALLPSQCLIVGDTERDLEAARANGMKCLLVGTGRHPIENPAGADDFLSDFSDTQASVHRLLKLL